MSYDRWMGRLHLCRWPRPLKPVHGNCRAPITTLHTLQAPRSRMPLGESRTIANLNGGPNGPAATPQSSGSTRILQGPARKLLSGQVLPWKCRGRHAPRASFHASSRMWEAFENLTLPRERYRHILVRRHHIDSTRASSLSRENEMEPFSNVAPSSRRNWHVFAVIAQ
jgi:hypothetical protein